MRKWQRSKQITDALNCNLFWLLHTCRCCLIYSVEIYAHCFTYFSENVKFSVDELSEIKRVSLGNLRLLGFKPLSCLKDYHNLKPSTFLFPSDEVYYPCSYNFIHADLLCFFSLVSVHTNGCHFVFMGDGEYF